MTNKSIKQKKATLIIPFIGKTGYFNANNYGSSVASDRLQIKPLIKALNNLRFQVRGISVNTELSFNELNLLEKSDLYVFSKLRPHPGLDFEKFSYFNSCCALKAKRLGSKILTIYSDNVCAYDTPDSELYKNLLFLSDAIATPSQKLASHVARQTNNQKQAAVIKDPCQLIQQNFRRIKVNEKINIIWFGNFPNLRYLRDALEKLDHDTTKNKNITLRILTSESGIDYCSNKLKNFAKKACWKIKLVPWKISDQPNQLQAELGRAHISLIPSNPNDDLKNGVSHNRLVDSIQSGCITIASPMDSYLDLSELALIGDDFSRLLRLAITKNEELCNQYTSLRQAKLNQFSPAENLKDWKKIVLDMFS